MIKKALIAAVALAAAAGLSGCSNPTGKSWAISYEVTGSGQASGITYSESVDRYQDDSSDHKLTGPLGLPWKQDVVLSAGREASVTATPSGNATFSCRILLDGTKELAKAASPAPGKPVTCSKTTDK